MEKNLNQSHLVQPQIPEPCTFLSLAIQVVSRRDFLLWLVSQVRSGIGWLNPQTLSHHWLSTSCRQDKLWVEGFVAELVSRSHQGKPALIRDDALFRFHSLHSYEILRLTFIGSRKVALHWISTLAHKSPILPVVAPQTHSVQPSPYLPPILPVPITTLHCSCLVHPKKFFFSFQEGDPCLSPLPKPFLLLSLSGFMDCSVIILHLKANI